MEASALLMIKRARCHPKYRQPAPCVHSTAELIHHFLAVIAESKTHLPTCNGTAQRSLYIRSLFLGMEQLQVPV